MNRSLRMFASILAGVFLSHPNAFSLPQSLGREKVSKSVPRVAFISDVHLHDIYGSVDGFEGLSNSKSQKKALIRTMYAQLNSTRLFNENYFVLRAALDDIAARGIRLVALPGDYTDDAQPVNIQGLRAILQEYEGRGLRFFLSPGNHDPNEPFEDEGGKDDFLGADGQNQKIYSPDSPVCRDPSPLAAEEKAVVICAPQIKELGYKGILEGLGDFGYKPRSADLYWETPFWRPAEGGAYRFEEASRAAAIEEREFEICFEGEGGAFKKEGYTNCSRIPDASYLVEPEDGIWLLSIDANVYRPKAGEAFDPSTPNRPGNYSGSGDAGYDMLLTHKTHLISWIASVAARAKQKGKRLIAFSHFPMAEFYSGQSDRIAQLFKPKAFQMIRRPKDATTQALAETGLEIHVAGHMHMNNTGVYPRGSVKDPGGHFLVNIQSPSLGVFGAAYKILDFEEPGQVRVKTVALDDVPRFDELFEHYAKEWEYLNSSSDPALKKKLWNREILQSKSYREFTRFYFGELSRLRFLDDYWPSLLKDSVSRLNGADMLRLAQAQDETAGERAQAIAEAAGLSLEDFSELDAYQFYGDFHRTVYAGSSGLRDLNPKLLKVYRTLFESFAVMTPETELQRMYRELFHIFSALLEGTPNQDFLIDLKVKSVSSLPSGS